MTPKKKTGSARGPRSSRPSKTILIATAKGAFFLDRIGSRWELSQPVLLGSRVHDMQLDPRDGRSLLVTATGGHLGPTVFRSQDRGKTLTEAVKPPAFRKPGKKNKQTKTTRGQSVKINFWLTPGHVDEPETWYLGTSPQGIFRSDDGGCSWKGLKGFNENENWRDWVGEFGTPDGGFLHSIRIDPRDPKHLYLSLSIGGTFESRDRGKSWTPLNRGLEADFMPDPDQEYGQDPHNMILHPANPDLLYQQNHCGLYRMDRQVEDIWVRIGLKMPKRVGDIGFVIVGHPTDADTIWTFPMDGSKLWPRTSPDGKPAVYVTRNSGRSFQRLDRGLPEKNAWYTVKRQAMCRDDEAEPNLYFGTTSGEIWMGRKGGEGFRCLARHLPQIFGLAAVRFS